MDYSRKDGKPGFTRRNKDGSTTFISIEDLEKEGKKEQFLKDLEKNTGRTFRQWEDSYLKRRGEQQLKLDQEKLKSKSEVELGRDDPFAPPESSNNTVTPDPTPLPTPPASTTPPPSTTPSASTTSTSTSTSTPTSKPKIPTGVAVSPKTGEKTKFERRIATSAELRAAQKARKDALDAGVSRGEAEYRATKAGVGVAKGTVKDPKIAADAARKAELERIRSRAASQTKSGVRPTVASTADPKTSTPISSMPTDTATKAATGGQNPRVQRLQVIPFKPGTKSEAYDVVLDYLLSEGHVDTVEEAHYVMLQMTSEHVRDIVEGEGYSNPSIDGNPIPYPKGHPKAGKPVSFNKAETKDMDRYRKASEKAGRKIYADEPLPKE